jgi:hypothetical protein
MVSLKFHDRLIYRRFVEVVSFAKDAIVITIIEDEDERHIFLDKSTAIKLSKELRKQIALLD